MRIFGNAVFFVMLTVLSLSLKAQNRKYTLSGQVFDSITALPISDPHLVVAGTRYQTIGSERGYYKIEKLIPGTNNLLIWAEGYDTAVVRFEIRKNMKLNIKLMQILDTASLHIEVSDYTHVIDSTSETKAPPIKTSPKKKKEKKEKKRKAKKKKSAKKDLTNKDKEKIKVLIEDVIFSKAIFFERFKNKRKSIYVMGSFTIDTGYLYTFKAKFSKKNGFELEWFDFKLKGKHSQ